MINIAGIMSIGVPVLIFLLILGLVVFVHELGHFIMARRAGIFVEEFAMGMGPKLLTFKGKKKSLSPIEGQENVTLYTLRALPLGGFCKMRGMEENVPEDTEAFSNKSVFSRFLVIAGGSAMNFLLAVLMFSILIFLTGYYTPIVTNVAQGMPAQQAGLQIGDRITHINGSRVSLWENFRFMLDTSGGSTMNVRVNRDGQRVNLSITPEMGTDGVFRIGMNPTSRVGFLDRNHQYAATLERAGIVGSIGTAIDMIGFHIRAPFRILSRFVTRQPVPEGAEVVSIIGIGAQVTEIYQYTMAQEEYAIRSTVITMLFLAALISVAIGTMNLLPIPALDGARLVFLIIEGIRRKPVSPEREGMVHMVGFVLLIVLLLFVAYRDIANLVAGSTDVVPYYQEAP
ncbi:MAG: M50 family metallopeptidase [Firmicutes bacterium]|nr:M50 family metallopeptidase [Bacillota bacterium]